MSKQKDEYGNWIRTEVDLDGSPAGSDQSEPDYEEIHEGPKLSQKDLDELKDIKPADIGSSSQPTSQAEYKLTDEQKEFVNYVRRTVNDPTKKWEKQGQGFFSKVLEKTTGKQTTKGNKTPDHITDLKNAVKYSNWRAYSLIKGVVDELRNEDLEKRKEPQKGFYKDLIEKFDALEKPSLGKTI